MPRPALEPHERPVVRTLRITQLQEQRLRRLSMLDSLAPQEHIRRAIDIYLNAMEKNRALAPLALSVAVASPTDSQGA